MDICATKKVTTEITNLRHALREMSVSIDEILSGVEEFGRAEQLLVEQATEAQRRAVNSLRFYPYYRERREKATLRRDIGKEIDNLVLLKEVPLKQVYLEMRKLAGEGGCGDRDLKFVICKKRNLSTSDPVPKEPVNEREATKSV